MKISFIFLMLCAISISVFAQKNSTRAGVLINGEGDIVPLLGYERSINEKFSGGIRFGYWSWQNYLGRTGRTLNTFHIGLEFRYYFFRPQSKILSGLYSGGYAAYDQKRWQIPDYVNPATTRTWRSVGIGLGYQYRYKDRFSADLGVNVGYGGNKITRDYDQQGELWRETPYPFVLARMAHLQIGYLF